MAMNNQQKRPDKPVVPQYQYKIASVEDSWQADGVEREMRRSFGAAGITFLSIGRGGDKREVMMDSGTVPLADEQVSRARTAAAAAKKKLGLAAE